MKQLLLLGFLMFGMIFSGVPVTKALDLDVYIGRDRDYRSYDDFSAWRASQRDRIDDAYRKNLIDEYEYDMLKRELNDIEAYHDQATSDGWVSDRERDRLERMEARLRTRIDKEISEEYVDD